ncbi:MAG: hypothetical protein E7239_12390 [Sarcina sp.]|nr:hypothetical protein [Sarcina sp.]MBE6002150.1 hypothetical protein [Sarcina sp.]MBR2728704.1 hypothetical protein [Lachnospiraceae bacterium]
MNDRKVSLQVHDLRNLNWTKVRRSSGTAGSFLKASETRKGVHWYYKLSDYDAYRGIVGHECVNEIIADRLLTLLNIPHLSYQLLHAKVLIDGAESVTWLCRSADFKKEGDSKIALDAYYQMERLPGESPYDFCIRQGWEEYISRMLIIDFLILNRDRHGANMEVLRNRAEKTIRLAPLFDHGLSFYFSAHEEKQLAHADPLSDKRIQCFVGSHSATDNLRLIPVKYRRLSGSLTKESRAVLFADLEDALPGPWRDAIWEMIWRRWEYYEDFCDS